MLYITKYNAKKKKSIEHKPPRHQPSHFHKNKKNPLRHPLHLHYKQPLKPNPPHNTRSSLTFSHPIIIPQPRVYPSPHSINILSLLLKYLPKHVLFLARSKQLELSCMYDDM